MKYVNGVVIALITQFLLVSAAFAGNSPAYSMDKDWKACSTNGIADSERFTSCITYPESGQDYTTCEHPPKAIYFTRHAPKRFRDITGQNNKTEYILSEVGQDMARHLAKIFKPLTVKTVYTSHYTRTRQTACPLMHSQGTDRQVVCKTETKSERLLLSALCKAHENEVVVVVGHVDTVNEMLINLKVVEPIYAPKAEFGVLYKVTFQNGKGVLQEPPIPYWKCGANGCEKNGAIDVQLK